jgi:hypothetical protein
MQTIAIGETIRTTDGWLTAVPSEGYTTLGLRESEYVTFELVVVNERGAESKPATATVYMYYTDDGPGGPGGIEDDGSGGLGGKEDPFETPPILVQPESM